VFSYPHCEIVGRGR